MLRITPQSDPAAAGGYYAQADYYATSLDASAVWGGKGAALLGLSGQVTARDFHALCDNRDPRHASPLTPAPAAAAPSCTTSTSTCPSPCPCSSIGPATTAWRTR